MRALVPALCLVLCGCNSRVSQQTVTDSTGVNRLALINRRVWSIDDVMHGRQSYDFHSLVWQTNAGGKWADRLVITTAAFQGGSPRRRSVSDIYSLDPIRGVALIKVAEESLPQTNAMEILITCVYSWREWSLLTNGEVRLIR